jgi:FKBP-type peptidyl-prolyl cis-trans isomerase FklB
MLSNKSKDGVKALPSGLQYRIIQSGTGATPTISHSVKRARNVGKFLDGKTFDSSHDRGEPTVFPVNKLIAGWSEALQLMKVGDKWELFRSLVPGLWRARIWPRDRPKLRPGL